ncbi:MAG: GldG family protein [candidate division Zixibacteria bacterium]|nr:GldG family protein [candidate division Zixibacteria bacterium]
MAMPQGLRKGLGSLTSVPIVIGLVVVINLLALAFFFRIDLTSSRLYSLSDASKKLARSLTDPVIVKLYFTEDLPAPYNANARYLKDQLYEYRAYSGGQLRFEFIDPIRQEKEDEAQTAGVPPVQVTIYEKDKAEQKKVYMGVVFLYEDKKEVLPLVQSTANLEYEISSAIQKITSTVVPKVGILGGHGESGSDKLKTAVQVLSKLYRVEPVTITPGELIDSSVSALFIISPADSIRPWDQYAIDQYLMRGGKIAAFLDPVTVDLQNQTASDRHTNWPAFLAPYGIRVQQALIIDARNAQIGVVQQQGYLRIQNLVQYPFMPQVFNFNKKLLLGKGLQGVDLPFVSPVDSALAESLGLEFKPICWSSEHSGIRRAPYYISPMQEFRREDFNLAGQVLAGTIQGVFKTAFPAGAPPDSSVNSAVVPPTLQESPLTRLVVVGDGDFCSDQSIRNPSNGTLFLNIADWLTQEEGLITIRSREVTTRPLEELSDGARRTVKYANIFGPPILVILFGVMRWQTRRRARQN